MPCDDCINRRQFLSAAAGAAGLVAVSGCGDGVVTGPFAEVASGPVSITVASLPGLATTGTLVQVPQQPIAVKRIGPTSFVAYSMVCTHQGCLTAVTNAGSRLSCGCHGSVFANDGTVINGPANSPLPMFTTAYDQATDTLTIN